jgi:hypothetical protein
MYEKTMSKRIYKVTDSSSVWLVRASNKSGAINHVARETIQAEVASQEDLVGLLKDGAQIHDAGSAPQVQADAAEEA